MPILVVWEGAPSWTKKVFVSWFIPDESKAKVTFVEWRGC